MEKEMNTKKLKLETSIKRSKIKIGFFESVKELHITLSRLNKEKEREAKINKMLI